MSESVRLVVWDLDNTFWNGTLTEGGITVITENCALVVELAKRGIISSICSKNDYGAVQRILADNAVLEYFVFPSVNWQAKGPRLRGLVDSVQLRPETIMFIDDNPLNLAEAKHFVPGIQVRSAHFVPEMLGHPLFRGTSDPDLTRLQQYQLLESRKTDQAVSGSDPAAFLRECDIRVRLDFNLADNLDRMIELINRTNQLNFTKARLSEDHQLASAALLKFVSEPSKQGALVHVRDRYGDHGYCGLYIYDSEGRNLTHFCFSCRILGMGVEQWIYQKLQRPHLDVKGEVLSDVFDQTLDYGWINQESGVPPMSMLHLSRVNCRSRLLPQEAAAKPEL